MTESDSMTQELEHFMLNGMPLARAMQLSVGAYDGDHLSLHAPLAANINDKGCAFGGSLGSLMTLAGWGLVTLAMRERGLQAEVFVANTEARYLTPLTEDLHASAQLAVGADWQRFFDTFAARGKARIFIASAVHGADGNACVQQARFVAKRCTALD
ncbi:MAG: thioesterase domain-containing protein [Xanthomonadales bacterium]|nr:thioesterase domain-containing protein [Xanthomonadales bacterium]